MAEVRIVCINKDGGNHSNSHEAISHYGWINAHGKRDRSTRAEMVRWIEEGNRAYVEDVSRDRAYCYVRTSPHGTKFLQTFSDGNFTNNLLSLPEC